MPDAPEQSPNDIAPLLRIGLEEDVDSAAQTLDATIRVDAPTPHTGSSGGGGSRHWSPPSVEELQKVLPQYEISAFIARGGMGAVYKGTQRTLRRPVAIKVLPPEIEDRDLQFASRFKHEAQAMAQLSHPNIVAVFDAGETPDGLLYFVMEFIEGTDVAQLIASEGQLEPRRAIQITTAVCEALAFAHEEGIIHRDIKPSNIMIDRKGRVKVADFGLAKTVNLEHSLQTQSNMALGTPDFIAPEALIPGMKVDQRADIYAVGVMLYQMLTGHIPRGRFELPSGVVPQVDKGFDPIVDKAMQTDREKRYSTAIEMKTAVEHVAQESAVTPARLHQTGGAAAKNLEAHKRTGAPRQAKPRRAPFIAAAVALVSLAAGGFLYFFKSPHLPAAPSSLPEAEALKSAGVSSSASPQASVASSSVYPVGKWTPVWPLVKDSQSQTLQIAKFSEKNGWIEPATQGGGNLLDPRAQSRNVALRATLRCGGDARFFPQLVLRSTSQAPWRGYALRLSQEGGSARLLFHDDRIADYSRNERTVKETLLDKPIVKGSTYTLELAAIGPRLIAKCNGQLIADIEDSALSDGTPGLRSGEPFRDWEILPLDGIPETEALKLAGLSEVPKSSAFPPGQWVNITERLLKRTQVTSGPDGWLKTSSTYVAVRELSARNAGFRCRFRGDRPAAASWPNLTLREVKSGDLSSGFQVKIAEPAGDKLEIYRLDAPQRSMIKLASQPLPAPIARDEEYTLEIYTIGQTVIGRCRGQTVVVAIAREPAERGVGAAFYGLSSDRFKDCELVNLDGLPEAEALRLVGVSSAPVSQGSPSSATLTFNGHRYQVLKEPGISWPEAKAKAEAMGGHLATLTSKEEADFVGNLSRQALPKKPGQAWLGATREKGKDAPWKWITGEPFSYADWPPNHFEDNNQAHYLTFQPGDAGRGEAPSWNNWVQSWDAARVRDHIGGYVVEWDAQTEALKLAGVSAAHAPDEVPYPVVDKQGKVVFPSGIWARTLAREVEAEGLAKPATKRDGPWLLWHTAAYEGRCSALNIEVAPMMNLGLRARFRGQRVNGEDFPQLTLRKSGDTPSPNLHIRDGKLHIRLNQPGYPVLADAALREPLTPGKEYLAEFYAIGSQLIARVNGQTLTARIDTPPVAGVFQIYGAQWDYFKDAEVINLDGLSGAEALKLGGLDAEKPSASTPAYRFPDGPPGFVKELNGHSGEVVGGRSVTILPDNRRLFTLAGRDSTEKDVNEAILWDVETGQPLWKRQLLDIKGVIGGSVVLPAVNQVAVIHRGPEFVVEFLDLESGRTLRQAKVDKPVNGAFATWLTPAPDGRRFMVLLYPSKVETGDPLLFQLWDASAPAPLARWMDVAKGCFVHTAAWLDDNRYMVNAQNNHSDSRFHIILDASQPGNIRLPVAEKDDVENSFVPVPGQPGQILTHRRGGGLAFYDLAKTTILRSFSAPGVQRQIIFVDSQRVLGLSEKWGDALRLWDTTSGRLLWELKDERLADALAASPDGRFAVTNTFVTNASGQNRPGTKLLVWRLPKAEAGLQPGVMTFGGHRYQFVPFMGSWTQAKAKAEAMGGHLATITSAEEHAWFLNNITPYSKHVWLGGYKKADNQWAWVTGESWKFTAWARHTDGVMEPMTEGKSPETSNETVLEFGWYAPFEKPGGWNDQADLDRHAAESDAGFLVEWDDKDIDKLAGTTPSSSIDNTKPTGYPQGQWVRPFAALADLNANWTQNGTTWQDGWITPGAGTNHAITLAAPNGRGKNWGVRARYRWQEKGTASLALRRSGKAADNTVATYDFRVSGSSATFRRCQANGIGTDPNFTALGESASVKLAPGDEVLIEAFAIGGTLYGRVNGQLFQAPSDHVLAEGSFEAAAMQTSYSDIEFINLDGLSEAEALKVVGIGPL